MSLRPSTCICHEVTFAIFSQWLGHQAQVILPLPPENTSYLDCLLMADEAETNHEIDRHIAESDASLADSTPLNECIEEWDFLHFPKAELNRLDDMINRPRWVIPVLPKSELEVLLNASIEFATADHDDTDELCQRFYREGLTISFTKILTDDAVNGWKPEIHVSI